MAAKKPAKSSRERAEAARRASEANLQRQLKRQRNVTIGIVAGVVAVVAAAVGITWYLISGVGTEGQLAEADVVVYDSGELVTPSVVSEGGGIRVGQDGIAGGSPAPEGAVRVDLYEDLLCPACRAFEGVNGEDLARLRAEGAIELYVHPIAILDRLSDGGFYSTRAAAAVYTIAEYSPEHFEAFFTALYVAQPPEFTKGLTNTEIAEIAAAAGASQDAIDKIAEGEFTRYVAAATEQSSIDGVRGTPTVFLNEVTYEGGWNIPGQLASDIGLLATAGAAPQE